MKKVIIIICLVIVLIAAIILAVLGTAGFFTSVSVTERATGPFLYVYKDFTGPYSKTKPVFDEVYAIAKQAGIESTKGIGLYYDDPSQVAADNLRSRCGLIVEDQDQSKIAAVQGKLKKDLIGRAPSVVIDFPIKSVMSYMVGPMKCYPALGKYVKDKSLTTQEQGIEVYDEAAKQIHYIFQLK